MKHKERFAPAVRAFVWSLMKGTGYLAGATGALGAHFSLSSSLLPALSNLSKDRHRTPGLVRFYFPISTHYTQKHTALPLWFSSPLLFHLSSLLPLLTSSPFQVGPAHPHTPDVLKEFYS